MDILSDLDRALSYRDAGLRRRAAPESEVGHAASLATCQTQGADVLGYALNHLAALMMVLRDRVLVTPGLASTSTSATTVLVPLR